MGKLFVLAVSTLLRRFHAEESDEDVGAGHHEEGEKE